MLFCMMAILTMSFSAYSGNTGETTRTFDKKESVVLNTIAGDCIIKKGDNDKVEVAVLNKYSPRDSFEPIFRERDHELRLEEKLYGSNSGGCTWIITVPDGTEIDFSSASGGMTISNYSGEIHTSTASGGFELVNCTGYFDMNTASGDYEIENCRGEFNINTASGDIDAYGIIITDKSNFGSASGDVKVHLGATAEYDLSVGSASGRATLDYNGNPLKGFFEFTCKKRGGRVDSPVDFDEEGTFRKHGELYMLKSFAVEGENPFIAIGTSSGRATLKE